VSADVAVNERWGEAARTRTAAPGARAAPRHGGTRCDSAVQEHAGLCAVVAYAPAGAATNIWRNGVDSPYGKSHRKDPQVAGDWEDDLTILRPQTA